ncbi:ESX secretion-associated protein EspG [Actinokineospora sp. 24-640]
MAKVELSVSTLYRLLHQLDLGEPHPLFTGGERYYSPRFKQEADAELRRALDAAGLNTSRGLDPEFVELLTVMQRAHVEFYGWLYDAEGPYSVLTAAAGRAAVLAERAGDKVTFEWVDAARLLDAFLFRLPTTPPARGEAMSVRLTDLSDKPRGGDFMRAPSSARPPEARRLEALLRAPRKGGGKLYTARRDPHGRRVRAQDWVDAIDLQEGRWALYRVRGRGEPFVTAVPGTVPVIGKRLSELQSSLH